MNERQLLDADLVALLEDAGQLATDQPKLKQPPEMKGKIVQMKKDGFTNEQIAQALGFEETLIAFLLEDKVLGSPEQILKESLSTLVALIPIADATYRDSPRASNAMALTSLIDSAKGVISELDVLKNKEEVYKMTLHRVIQPFVRSMIADLMAEFKHYVTHLEGNADKDKLSVHLQSVAVNLGKKLDELYRKSAETLAQTLGINQETKNRILSGGREAID